MGRFDYLGIVVKDLKSKFFSSFLTLIAISLGILIIFVIFLISQGFENSIEKQFEQLGSNRLYVTSVTTNLGSTTFSKGLLDSDVKLIESKPYVREVFAYYSRTVQVEFNKKYASAIVFGSNIDKHYFESFNLDIDVGRFPKLNEKYSMVIGPKAATDLFDKEIKVGSNVYIKGVKFKVVGILKSVGNPQDDKNLYVQIDTLRNIFEAGNQVGLMDVIVDENYDINFAKDNLQVFLDRKLGEDKVKIIMPTQILDKLNSILSIVKITLGGIAFVSLIVGAVGIINTMYVVVVEKTKDIGIMKSIGAENKDILFMFIFQAGSFGFLGGILGVIFGSLIAKVFESIAKSQGFGFLEINIELVYVVFLILFSTFIGMISGFLPAYRASKINILEAIRK